MMQIFAFIGKIGDLILEKLRSMEAPMVILLVLVVGTAAWFVFTGRTDKQMQDSYVLGKEKDCQTELKQCRTEKDYDNKQLNEKIENLNKYWNAKYDSIIQMVINNKVQLESIKNKR